MTFEDAGFHRRALLKEIQILESRILPHGTGQLSDTIAVLSRRVGEIDKAFMIRGFIEG